MILTAKERMLLQDEKSHEEACVQKYQDFANQAQDPQLKQLFSTYASKEQEHLNTLNQILNGQVPALPQQGQQQASQNNMSTQGQGSTYNENDKKLCTDALITEKYVSSTYNTTIFECCDTNIRQILNHIQKEEQEHGEGIFNYMRNTGMYTPQ